MNAMDAQQANAMEKKWKALDRALRGVYDVPWQERKPFIADGAVTRCLGWNLDIRVHANERACDECPVCCETGVTTYTNEEHAGAFHSACSCHACADCIKKWVELQLPACRATFQVRVQCYGCHKMMPQKLVMMCEAAGELATQLQRREVLQRNSLFPKCMQVECRRTECVGIGYLGYETIMCMVCEDQWAAAEETVVHFGDHLLDVRELAKLSDGELATVKLSGTITVAMRKCPNCGMITEKNGGCDHMRCLKCNHEYYWSTGKKYR
uniref:RING-type domain-containing protein n=1 Tax=Haptolina brevifila TaxID=156173 RepID=A0A7S2GDL8_9EUKA